MFNSRDAYTNEFSDAKEVIEVPYKIGTVLELKEDANILARIVQYRIFVSGYKQVIMVGVNTNISERDKIECEFSMDELLLKFHKTDKFLVENVSQDERLHIPGYSRKVLKKS